MWIDPLVKWQAAAQSSAAAAELLAGRPEEARALFEADNDLVGAGDALLALGQQERAVACYERASGDDLIVDCGLAQALVLRGNPQAAVVRMEQALARHPGNPVAQHQLTGALLETADQARSLTRDEELVITSRTQFDICAAVAARAAVTAVDEAHRAAVARLTAELADGQRWMWSNDAAVAGYALFGGGAGLAVVGLGGVNGNIVLVVSGAILGAAAVYAVVAAFRRQAWQVRATEVAPMVWRHGVR
nr:hypothetical protein [Kibdelosporangium sp. MJ126-NF4]CEL21683.1 hypothetical protein [Kibdelosporangium sp. MJ126-NF4]CTQ92463.1 hypothetical protein [Kibdelosporangium sp. MJ126-NF4]